MFQHHAPFIIDVDNSTNNDYVEVIHTMKRMIRSSRNIRASVYGDPIMNSKAGYFSLVETSGTGINRTPWTGYTVIGGPEAKKYVVEIHLDRDNVDMNGDPVQFTYRDVYVAHGFGSKVESLEETAQYIKVLQDALDFAYEIQDSDIIRRR